METFILSQDVINRIKSHPDITKEDKERYKESLKGLFMTDKRKEQTFKEVKSNQQRTYERTTNDNDRVC
jgi:hypothetical protein